MRAPSESRPVSVLVVAPPLLAWGMENMVREAAPRLRLAGSAPDLGRALLAIKALSVDVAAVLLEDPPPFGALADLCANSSAKVLVVANSADRGLVDAALMSGARGVLGLSARPPALVNAVEKIHEGELSIERDASSRILSRAGMRKSDREEQNRALLSTLTARERETLSAMVLHIEASGKVVARMLRISEHTLRNHLSSIYNKLGVPNRAALYAYAMTHNLCAPWETR